MEVFAVQGNPKVQYTLTGANSQVLTIAMKTGDVVHSEPGTMMMMSNEIKTGLTCGSCSRTCVGESLCTVSYTNAGQEGFLALTPNNPGKIVPIDLNSVGGHLIAKGGAYVAHVGNVHLTADCDCSCFRSCCGGMGFLRQSVKGDGTVFLGGGGTIIMKTLQPMEKIIVDTNSIIGYANSVKLSVRVSGGCCTMCCGGEGFFNSVLEGPGLVILESMSFDKYRAAIAPPMEVEKEQPHHGAH